MKKSQFSIALVFAFTFLSTNPVFAQIELSDCAGEVGAAFGLCNAYCEAMDCDSDFPNANETACNKVFDKFVTSTGGEPPCLVNLCERVACSIEDEEICDPSTGLCVFNPCARAACLPNQFCDPFGLGECENGLCFDVLCQVGSPCNPDTGRCEEDKCFDVACPIGPPAQECNPNNGMCEPIS
jgi:hypothetical protein